MEEIAVRVLVSGGTGFVGAHTVKALADAGHSVKLLVRDPARIDPALGPLGVSGLDFTVGNVTDREEVARALDGCEAVIHCASVYSNDPRRSKEIAATNLAGAKVVLGQAAERGLDPIVHVSSIVALLPAPDHMIREDGPVGSGAPPYATSKQEQERSARELQEQGAPVVITYPGSVWGPHDPHDGESTLVARNFKRGLVPFVPMGRLPVVDVRDVAAAHARVLEPGKGPRRYVLGGEAVRLSRLAKGVCREAGVHRPRIPIPRAAAYMGGRMTAPLQRALPFRLPIDPSSTWVIWCNAIADNSRAERELGVTFRPLEETLRDQIGWQKAAGRL
jgi:nucleoside-diphosphate-sugar epimerase